VEERPDLDHEKIAYYGSSWGGYLGAIIPTVSPRVDAVVLRVAGLTFQRALPEVEALNYLPRLTIPVIMINGEHDFFFPVETSQKPMFDFLGSPPELKRHVVYPGSHSVPLDMLTKESLDWLDAHLGPVER
jgi:pimeloyl-ACP methyl ester carboxylesterase